MSIDLFAEKEEARTVYGRLNAGIKLLVASLVTVLLVATVDAVTGTVALALEMVALAAGGFKPVRLLLRFWPILLATLLSGWATAIMADKTGDVLLEFAYITVTTDSAEAGLGMMMRGLAMAMPALMFITTTDPTDLADSLAQTYKLPARFVLAALAALRLVGIMFAEWRTLSAARRARGAGGRGPVNAVRNAAGQVFVLLVQAIRRGTRLATTMEARGFGAGQRTWARVPQHSGKDAVFAVLWVAIPLIAYAVSASIGTLKFLL
ncbi:energy-coupling factor transporter transmembrane protein EcfT [Rothia sp. ZJ932]|uniref:energy-coupling factor transporter transmembrane component T family protein n=1 Tax=Rothia sp. ZJ932 TaxID=2810516 RepID=UPI00196702BC|nr:energy-coupling factor transporter transmembrane component T [Rothia sp. ZJ932]QRZ61295.1 energy-coupling factor transporter transmembrane protein EcfT [Rothia sp. ZJ932]